MREWCWISSHVLIGYFCIIFGEMSVQVNFHDFALSHLYWFKQVNWNKLWRLDWYCGFSANKFCPQITSSFLEAVSTSTVLKITFLKKEIHKSIMHLPFFFFFLTLMEQFNVISEGSRAAGKACVMREGYPALLSGGVWEQRVVFSVGS